MALFFDEIFLTIEASNPIPPAFLHSCFLESQFPRTHPTVPVVNV